MLTPPGAVTETVLVPTAAVVEKANVVVICVSLATVIGPTVTPPPDTVTAVAPVSPLPKILTLIVSIPRKPDAGWIDVSTGPSTV